MAAGQDRVAHRLLVRHPSGLEQAKRQPMRRFGWQKPQQR